MAEDARTTKLSRVRRSILAIIKRRGATSIRELAAELEVSYEGARQQVGLVYREGWLERRQGPAVEAGAGRPRSLYALTPAGEHLFPKAYDDLSVELIDALMARFGVEGLVGVLGDLATARIERWGPDLQGLDLQGKLEALRGLYMEEDPYMEVEEDAAGDLRLVERNCPFYNVARQRPALCSLTVSVMSRLLGYEVVREERFQAGDGRCVFRVRQDRPLAPDAGFELESPAEG